MKGSNTLLFNQATMVHALQEYLDKRYTPGVTVTGIKLDTTRNHAGTCSESFVIDVAEKKENAKAV